MAKQTTKSASKTAPAAVNLGLAFELEKLAVAGQALLFESAAKILKEKHLDLTPVLWSRFGLDTPLAEGLSRLLAWADKPALSAEKLAKDILDAYLQALARPSTALNPDLDVLLKEAASAGWKAGALSALGIDQAAALVARLKLQDRVLVQPSPKGPLGAPSPEGWLTVCKTMGLLPRCCVALTVSAGGTLAALKAGLHCVAIPDNLAACQDFGGADIVADSFKDARLSALKGLLHGCAFR